MVFEDTNMNPAMNPTEGEGETATPAEEGTTEGEGTTPEAPAAE